MRECGVAVYGVSRPQRVAPGGRRGVRGARAPRRRVAGRGAYAVLRRLSTQLQL